MCRVRNLHLAAPWTTAYICMTLDETCTGDDGRYVDKPMVARMVPWQPYCSRDDLNPTTPVCASCKKTNRTRSFCRERHKHRHLPWCTVYVLLSTEESVDPATIVAAPSRPVNSSFGDATGEAAGIQQQREAHAKGKVRVKTDSPVGVPDEASTAESKNSESIYGSTSPENVSPGDEAKRGAVEVAGDDVNDIPHSRTMLIEVSTRSTNITWLELAESDNNSAGLHMGTAVAEHAQYPYGSAAHHSSVAASIVEPTMGYHYPLGYAQHQSALKTHQQQYFYQLQQRQDPYAPPQSPWQYTHPMQPPPPHGYVESVPQPHTPQQSPTSPVSDETPAPVTAGEAAAQQQIRSLRSAEESADGHSPTPHPPHPGMVHYQHPFAVPTVAQVSPMVGTQLHAQPHHLHHQQQQHPWMIYQQMYQAQLPLPAQAHHQHPANLHPAVSTGTPEPAPPEAHGRRESPLDDEAIPANDVSRDYSSEGNEGTQSHDDHGEQQQHDNDEDDEEVDEGDDSNKRRRLA
jgi:hypothetical protein